ncbi:MAG: hypothetical protein ACR2IV_09680 [Bryobacteraceae bacterium]
MRREVRGVGLVEELLGFAGRVTCAKLFEMALDVRKAFGSGLSK